MNLFNYIGIVKQALFLVIHLSTWSASYEIPLPQCLTYENKIVFLLVS